MKDQIRRAILDEVANKCCTSIVDAERVYDAMIDGDATDGVGFRIDAAIAIMRSMIGYSLAQMKDDASDEVYAAYMRGIEKHVIKSLKLDYTNVKEQRASIQKSRGEHATH